MSGLVIDAQKCRGCGRCVRACANRAIQLGPDRRPVVGDTCTVCGICVDSCPFGAISVSKDTPGGADVSDYRDVWVFAQVASDATLMPVALELVGKGRELADARGARLVALLGFGMAPDADGSADAGGRAGAAPLVDALISCGADEVVLCEDGRLATNDAEVYANWVCRLVEARKPEILLIGATSFGRELAPGIAARLRTGLTADCTVLGIDPQTGLLHQTRPAFGGNLMATIVCPDHRPQMATVRPGVLAAPEPDAARTGIVTPSALEASDLPRVRVLQTLADLASDSIVDADVLVVVGRGIGSQKNLPLMRRLADLLGAKLGCSRPLVEAGWLEYRHQVGQTGVSVAPKLLVSVGVSGAIQHLAGIGGAQTLVAINSDPSAPIFGVSQYEVVGDCVEVVKELVDVLEHR